MKKYIAGFIIITFLGAVSWGTAQGTKTELFDVTKAQQEIEIMKGILSTTLSFVAQSLQKQPTTGARGVATPFGAYSPSWRVSNMNAFYLYGQGVVFVIPTSGLRLAGSRNMLALADLDNMTADMARASAELARASREFAVAGRGTGSGVVGGVSGAVAGGAATGAAPKPAQAATPPATPVPPQVNQEELRKKVAEAQERVKKSQAEAEANRAKFLASLSQIKVYLIEALANHGDSLTTVKPNEYLTLVISTDDYDGFMIGEEGGSRTHREIISVQKSWITDYKAGRLTLDAFKQKALQYSE
jgi:hypothetical protein